MEQIYECQVCGKRILRTKPVDEDTPCPYCENRGTLEPYPLLADNSSSWIDDLIDEIEGKGGRVVWK